MRRWIALTFVVVVLASAFGLAGCRGSEVPDVVGMRQDEAVRVLQDAGLKLGEVSAAATSTVEIGMVAAQDPPAGEKADKDSAALDQAGFPVTVQELPSDTAAGTVGFQFPPAGSEVMPGTPVLIVVAVAPWGRHPGRLT